MAHINSYDLLPSVIRVVDNVVQEGLKRIGKKETDIIKVPCVPLKETKYGKCHWNCFNFTQTHTDWECVQGWQLIGSTSGIVCDFVFHSILRNKKTGRMFDPTQNSEFKMEDTWFIEDNHLTITDIINGADRPSSVSVIKVKNILERKRVNKLLGEFKTMQDIYPGTEAPRIEYVWIKG